MVAEINKQTKKSRRWVHLSSKICFSALYVERYSQWLAVFPWLCGSYSLLIFLISFNVSSCSNSRPIFSTQNMYFNTTCFWLSNCNCTHWINNITDDRFARFSFLSFLCLLYTHTRSAMHSISFPCVLSVTYVYFYYHYYYYYENCIFLCVNSFAYLKWTNSHQIGQVHERVLRQMPK